MIILYKTYPDSFRWYLQLSAFHSYHLITDILSGNCPCLGLVQKIFVVSQNCFTEKMSTAQHPFTKRKSFYNFSRLFFSLSWKTASIFLWSHVTFHSVPVTPLLKSTLFEWNSIKIIPLLIQNIFLLCTYSLPFV